MRRSALRKTCEKACVTSGMERAISSRARMQVLRSALRHMLNVTMPAPTQVTTSTTLRLLALTLCRALPTCANHEEAV